jgi:hypothetical protein
MPQDTRDENGEKVLDFEQIGAILHNDPFAEEETDVTEVNTETETDVTEDSTTDIIEPVPEIDPETEALPEPVPEIDPKDVQINELQTKLDAVLDKIAVLTNKTDEVKTTQDETNAITNNAEAETAITNRLGSMYAVNLNDTIMATLDSEDSKERASGIGQLMQGLGMTVHKNVLKDVAALIQNQVPQYISNSNVEATQAASIKEDFYGKYPTLNTPTLRGVVASKTNEIVTRDSIQEWSPALRDLVAKEVFEALKVKQNTQTITPKTVQPKFISDVTSTGAPKKGEDLTKLDLDQLTDMFF